MQLVPRIWAEAILVSLYRGLSQPSETLEETQRRIHQHYKEHERRMAEDPEYARQREEMMREWNERWTREECECE